MAQGISRRDALKLGAAAAGFGVLRMTSVAQARQNSDTLLKAGIVTDHATYPPGQIVKPANIPPP